jgi:hypothetical protein
LNQDLTRSNLIEDLVPSRLNPVRIIAVPITIHFGSSTAPNENLALILFKFRPGKKFLGILILFNMNFNECKFQLVVSLLDYIN